MLQLMDKKIIARQSKGLLYVVQKCYLTEDECSENDRFHILYFHKHLSSDTFIIKSHRYNPIGALKWALSRENLSSRCPTKRVSDQFPQLQRLARKLKFHL